MDREEETVLLRKQMEEMQRALSYPEVQQLLHTLDKGKEKQGLESGEIPQDSTRKDPQIVEQSQREAQVGPSQKRVKQNEGNQRPDSPQFSFMKDLDGIVPEQDMNLEPEREEAKNGEVQSKRRISDEDKSKKRILVDDKSKSIHKKKHQKKKTFNFGDKDVKFEAYNGRQNNDKALAFIRQFEVAFAEGNFKERSKLRHVSMYLKGTASSWWLTQILEGKKPKDWSAFKEAFYSQFVPLDFEQEVRKEWDHLSQWEDESVPQYVDRFWDVLLKDIWAELGRPCGIHKKQVDPMVIHSASDSKQRTTLCGDYFYNYFSRGIDILFDGQANRIKKFVLHTNFPGHTDFNSYIKCNFIIDCRPSDEHVSEWYIRPETKWNQVKEFLGDGGRAAIQTQGSVSNPFGPTFVYSYRDIALEVMKNGHIATVTLFQSTVS
ncbi:hypothetical protein L7F22_031451 [Adiantum nelumboides]|nr:hypothetical protein [Adiantum nelumboides]